MLISIITVTLNSSKTLKRTLDSVLMQSYDSIEYIVVDGKSSDGTIDILKEYDSRFKKKGINFFWISEKDSGMYDALNKGALLSSGELVGQLNSDDWYEPNALEIISESYRINQFDAAWGNLIMQSNKKKWIKKAKIGRIWSTNGWCHPALFSRRDVLIENPYPLESMFDDFDYITSLKCQNKHLLTINDNITNFSFGSGGMSTLKSFSEVKKRVKIVSSIYRKYNFSRAYIVYRWIYELLKYIVS